MSRICLEFMTQQEANDAVVALSKHYQVTQFSSCVTSDGYPYFVNVIVPKEDVYDEDEETKDSQVFLQQGVIK